MNNLQKIAVGLMVLLGVGGFALGMLGAFAPSNAMSFMSLGSFGNFVPFFFIGLVILITVLSFSPLIKTAMDNMGKKKRLLQIGTKGVATILSVQDTGITVNNNPFIKMEVEVKSGITAVISTTVSRVGIPRPGDRIQIVYDPAKPTDAIIAP